MAPGIASMTGHADATGAAGTLAWTWEARSVNGRGLDVRVRLPESFESLEAGVRAAFAAAFSRGSVNVGLRVSRAYGPSGQRVNADTLAAVLAGVGTVRDAALAAGLDLAPMTLGELLAVRGVLEAGPAAPLEDPETAAGLAEDLARLVDRLGEARADEGRVLAGVIAGQVDRIAALTAGARVTAEARAARSALLLRGRVEALVAAAAPVDEGRLAQELALLAVRLDVTEELDRLDAHITAARKLLAGASPVGRKLDFLTQEFNREANTLCSKAQDMELAAIGLDLKLVIDQMREQVQNVE